MREINNANLMKMTGACLLLLAAGCSCSDSRQQSDLSSSDVEAIKAADQAYATAWLRNNPDEVMATLTNDAVLIPSGLPQLEGTVRIREFWWPPDSPPTTVTEFTLRQGEAGGSGDFAYVRGSFTLGFEYDGETYSNTGDYLSILRKLPDSSWRISRRMWNDHPRQPQ